MSWSNKSSQRGSRLLGSWSKGMRMLGCCCFGMKAEPLNLLHSSQFQSVPALFPTQIVNPCAFMYGKKCVCSAPLRLQNRSQRGWQQSMVGTESA